jgi:membrane protein YdbS with pleckstrin-like domain
MDNNKKHSLGHRAFFIFFAKRLKGVIFLAILTGVAWYAERWLPQSYLYWADRAVIIIGAVSAAYLLIALFETWLEYHYYTYTFTEEAFLMTYGYLVRNEVAALYHQIQNVSIQRTIGDRLVGVSRIIIFLTGSERESGHTKIILPGVGGKKAKLVQKELLVRARKMAGS